MDVRAGLVIALPPGRVAAYAMDWRNIPEWTQGIRSAELTAPADDGGFGVGAEVTRTVYFLGRRLDYVLRVVSYDPPSLLEMKSVVGPFPMRVTYRFDADPAGTSASVRFQGHLLGLYRLVTPFMWLMVLSNIRRDLRDLARILT